MSIIAAPTPQHPYQALTTLNNGPFGAMRAAPTMPLSPTATRLSRDTRVFTAALRGKPTAAQRMTLLSWFLEEEQFRRYDHFKDTFYEDTEDYNYALTSLLGNFVLETSSVGSGITNFVAPNQARRNQLLPFQSALTEKWKVLGSSFTYSWNTTMEKSQREFLVMQSFLDTANISPELANARKQSFDLRTSDLSGRAFIAFIQEHCLQATNQTGITVSLPHTDSMVRIFKAWVEQSSAQVDEERGNDALFHRSCALALRDKAIYARAMFSTRLCLTVLEKWEKIIRDAEQSQLPASKPSHSIDTLPVTEVKEEPVKSQKPKKKKKSKASKKAKKHSEESIDAVKKSDFTTEKLIPEDLTAEEPQSDDECSDFSNADCSKSSGVSSPTGTGDDFALIHEKQSTKKIARSKEHVEELRGTVTEPASLQLSDNVVGGLVKKASKQLVTSTDISTTINHVVNALHTPFTSQATTVDPDLSVWEAFPMEVEEQQWEPVVTKKRKNHPSKKTTTVAPAKSGNEKGTLATAAQSLGEGFKPQPKSITTAKPQEKSTKLENTTNAPNSINAAPIHKKPGSLDNKLNHGEENKSLSKARAGNRLVNSVSPGNVNGKVSIANPAPKNVKPGTLAEKVSHPLTSKPAKNHLANTVAGSTKIEPAGNDMSPSAKLKRLIGVTDAQQTSSETIEDSIVINASQGPISRHENALVEQSPRLSDSQTVTAGSAESKSSQESSSTTIDLDKITFFCQTCKVTRSHQNSISCGLCGPLTYIRYCSEHCKSQDQEHWRLCGICNLPSNVTCAKPQSTGKLHPRSQYYLPGTHRQLSLMESNKTVDYFIVSSTGAAVHQVHLQNGLSKTNFPLLITRLMRRPDGKAVTLLYRILKSHLDNVGYKIQPEELARQLWDEYGIDALRHWSHAKVEVTAEDWNRAGFGFI